MQVPCLNCHIDPSVYWIRLIGEEKFKKSNFYKNYMQPSHFVRNKKKKGKNKTIKISISKLKIVKPLNENGISHT